MFFRVYSAKTEFDVTTATTQSKVPAPSDHFATPFTFGAAFAGVFAGVLEGAPLGRLFLAWLPAWRGFPATDDALEGAAVDDLADASFGG